MTAPYYTDDAVTVWHGDARALPLEAGTVDLIVTSPPYYALRSYRDGGEHYAGQIGDEPTPGEYLDNLLDVTRECVRVLKPSGSLWVNLGDKYAERAGPARAGGIDDDDAVRRPAARPTRGRRDVPVKSLFGLPWRYAIRCVDELGLILRAEIVWAKLNPMPESVTDRVRRTHETWFHFTLRPRYFAAIDAVRDPYAASTAASYAAGGGAARIGEAFRTHPSHTGRRAPDALPEGYAGNPLGRLPGSVWEIAAQPLKLPPELDDVEHFAAFPMEWPRRIIAGWCPPGGVVLDPLGGTGTTALVARALGRRAHTVDRSRDYCRVTRWRVTDPGELARALEVEKPPPVPEGIDSLLDLLVDEGAPS